MAEAFPGSEESVVFGPTEWDIDTYSDFLRELKGGYDPGFNPAVTAQLIGARIDTGDVGCFIDPDNPTSKDTTYRIAQGRWVASVLGLRVTETEMHLQSGTAVTRLEMPSLDTLPERPTRNNGVFFDSAGRQISAIQADAIGAAHYIASHLNSFTQPKAFEKRFERVEREVKEDGVITVPAEQIGKHLGDGLSFYRQITRVLGYKPGSYVVDEDRNAFVLKVAVEADGTPQRLPGFGKTTDPGVYKNGLTASVAKIRQRGDDDGS